MRGERWEDCEMRALKRACCGKSAPDFGPDLYRGMVAERNDWSYSAGALDINAVESYWRQFEAVTENNP